QELGLPEDIINVEGGAIAHGHPIGATGAVLTTRLIHSMRRDGLKRGMVTLCIGGGQGIALAIETFAWQRKQSRSAMSTPAAEPVAKPQPHSFWIPVICGAVILTIGIGARQSFGIFQKPIAMDLHVGRELWSFANALALLLMGAFSPFVGNIADRFGTART